MKKLNPIFLTLYFLASFGFLVLNIFAYKDIDLGSTGYIMIVLCIVALSTGLVAYANSYKAIWIKLIPFLGFAILWWSGLLGDGDAHGFGKVVEGISWIIMAVIYAFVMIGIRSAVVRNIPNSNSRE